MDIDAQWAMIMEDSFFTEEFIISSDAGSMTVHGVFYSGNQEEQNTAAYATKRFVVREYLSIASPKLIEAGLEYPFDELKRATVTNPRRGNYRVLDVSGGQSGTVTLSLQSLRRNKPLV